METIEKKTAEEIFEAGKNYGREEGLFDFGHLKMNECKAPSFEEYASEKLIIDDRVKTIREKALLWMANYIHFDLNYITMKYGIVHFEKLTIEQIEKMYIYFNPDK